MLALPTHHDDLVVVVDEYEKQHCTLALVFAAISERDSWAANRSAPWPRMAGSFFCQWEHGSPS
jgi:hypothetical protein